jgi:hypothetical protein
MALLPWYYYLDYCPGIINLDISLRLVPWHYYPETIALRLLPWPLGQGEQLLENFGL